MLKEIPSSQLRRGMYLSKLCGSWLKHPFWKRSFVLEDEQDIRAILQSGIERVVIDISKGLDVEESAASPEQAATQQVHETPDANASDGRSFDDIPRVSMEAEWNKARQICDQAKGAVAQMFQEVRMGKTIEVADVQPIVEDISSSVIRNPGALINIARLKTMDDYTYMHSVAVCAMMTALARKMGMSDQEVLDAAQGGLLHDVGKAAVPPEVLNKPGKLTDAEFGVVKAHPKLGWEMLSDNDEISQASLDVVLHHHEKYDGRGYPDGLKGEEISVMARMGAVCDVYDALTSNRCYKKGWSPALAVKKMASWEGHFDPKILQAFIKILGIYPVGSLVQLSSGKLAVVTEQTEDALLKPKVKAFFSIKLKAPIPITVIDLSARNCEEKVVSLEVPENWDFKDRDSLWML